MGDAAVDKGLANYGNGGQRGIGGLLRGVRGGLPQEGKRRQPLQMHSPTASRVGSPDPSHRGTRSGWPLSMVPPGVEGESVVKILGTGKGQAYKTDV